MNPVPLLQDYLIDSARRLPEKVALVAGANRLTYAELARRTNALAHTLRAQGVRRGDRVVVFADNGVEAAIGFWAALVADGAAVVVNAQTKADKLAYLLNDSGARAMITQASLTPVFAEAARRAPELRAIVLAGAIDQARVSDLNVVPWDVAMQAERSSPPRRNIDVDLAAIVYTSGSTGEPKGVMLTHRNMMTAATSITSYLRNVEDDVILGLLPLAFDYGLYQMIMAFRMGARLILERGFAFPAKVLDVVAKERVTGFPGVPTVYAVLKEMRDLSAWDLSSVRYVTNTAAALPLSHIEFLKRTFPGARIYSMYGLTECKRCTYLPPEDLERKPSSVGVAIPNTELWLVDDEGQRITEPWKVGQLVIRGATVMKGYWQKPEQTAKKLKPGPLPGEHVLHTGDYCKLDEEGYLYFVGRMDDVIKSRGEKVAPKEIENVLLDVPGVKLAAVIGVPDELLGEAPKAFVVLEKGASLDEKELRRRCQEKLEPFMVPKAFEFRPDLPQTATGKISKQGLA